MRTITIEIEGKMENTVIAQMMQAARAAARGAKGTYVFAGLDMPAKGEVGEISIPSFVRQGRQERMGVIR